MVLLAIASLESCSAILSFEYHDWDVDLRGSIGWSVLYQGILLCLFLILPEEFVEEEKENSTRKIVKQVFIISAVFCVKHQFIFYVPEEAASLIRDLVILSAISRELAYLLRPSRRNFTLVCWTSLIAYSMLIPDPASPYFVLFGCFTTTTVTTFLWYYREKLEKLAILVEFYKINAPHLWNACSFNLYVLVATYLACATEPSVMVGNSEIVFLGIMIFACLTAYTELDLEFFSILALWFIASSVSHFIVGEFLTFLIHAAVGFALFIFLESNTFVKKIRPYLVRRKFKDVRFLLLLLSGFCTTFFFYVFIDL